MYSKIPSHLKQLIYYLYATYIIKFWWLRGQGHCLQDRELFAGVGSNPTAGKILFALFLVRRRSTPVIRLCFLNSGDPPLNADNSKFAVGGSGCKIAILLLWHY